MAGQLAVLAPLLLLALYISTLNLASITTRRLRRKRIGLVIAHPDDEAMFFAPSVIQMANRDWENEVSVLCLSNGNAQGLGETRQNELQQSLQMMGIASENQRCLSNEAFPDSMTAEWSPDDISSALSEFFGSSPSPASDKGSKVSRKGKSASTASVSAPTGTSSIDILITFDKGGVSGHKNHISLLHGAKKWCTSQKKYNNEIELYTLSSVNILRKYTSWLDLLFTVLTLAVGMFNAFLARLKKRRQVSSSSSTRSSNSGKKTTALQRRDEAAKGLPFLFISTVWTWRLAQRTMTEAHVSQMVWFRWGWILLSRYMLVNDLHAVPID